MYKSNRCKHLKAIYNVFSKENIAKSVAFNENPSVAISISKVIPAKQIAFKENFLSAASMLKKMFKYVII